MKKLGIFWSVAAGLIIIACPLQLANAQEALPPAVSDGQGEGPLAAEESPQEKAQKLAVVVEQEMRELAASLKLVAQDSGEAAANVIAERQVILERTRLYLDQLITTFKKKEQLALETVVVRKELERAPEASDEKVGFAEIETLRDKLFLAQDNQHDVEDRIENARVMLKEATADFEKAHRQRRAIKDSLLEVDAGSSETLLLAELEARAVGTLQDLRKQELSYLEDLQANATSQVELFEKRLSPYRQSRLFSKKDLKKELHKIGKKEDKFRVSLDALKKMAVRYETDWLKENALSSLGSEQLPIGSKYETAALGKSTTQSRLRIVSETLQKTAKAREMWQQRLVFNASDMSRSALGALADDLKDSLQRHNRDKDMLSTELEQVKRELSTLTAYLSSGNIKYQQKLQLETQLKILNEHRTELQSILDFHNDMLTSTRNFLAEVGEAIGNETWKDLLLIAGDYLLQIWGYELFSSNDYPVTVSKLLISVFVFLFGYFSSGAFSRKLAQILADRFRFSQGARAAFEALSFYILIAIFVTIALRTANVPLTAFTFLGGALAIGIGFGSQNVMNNFISGLILLTEQPIRVGDMIEMETFFGTVKKIGARSTTLRTSTNIDIVVPNSSFLEKSVVNWTRHNTQMQLKVTVGVMYGSDTELVSTMLLDSANNLPKVLSAPAPFVLFSEFGDNALIFELRFWANVRNMTERLQIESEVRYRIERLSREREIVIAYPQRDIHIDTTRPLEVRLER